MVFSVCHLYNQSVCSCLLVVKPSRIGMYTYGLFTYAQSYVCMSGVRVDGDGLRICPGPIPCLCSICAMCGKQENG